MKNTLIIVAFLFTSSVSFAQDITQGTWFSEEKDSRVQFFKQGDKLFGKIVWLKDPNENGKPKLDKNNPDEKQRAKTILNLVFLKNFSVDSPKVWDDGEIYDPRNGKTYSCKLTIVSPTTIEVRGFIGISILGRTSVFTKAE